MEASRIDLKSLEKQQKYVLLLATMYIKNCLKSVNWKFCTNNFITFNIGKWSGLKTQLSIYKPLLAIGEFHSDFKKVL